MAKTCKDVVSHWLAQLPEYAPAAAQWISEHPQLEQLLEIDRSIDKTLRFLESSVTVNGVSRDIVLNSDLSAEILAITLEGIQKAFEAALVPQSSQESCGCLGSGCNGIFFGLRCFVVRDGQDSDVVFCSC
jgi:hypothetical protein